MPNELDELLDFLGDKRSDVRAKAAEVIQGLTGSEDDIPDLVERRDRVIPALLRLLGGDENEATPAATALGIESGGYIRKLYQFRKFRVGVGTDYDFSSIDLGST